jgi:hypothetical protein
MKNILVLFPKDWDRAELGSPRFQQRYRFFFEGFDLFSFPSNARLLTFDIRRFVEHLVRKYRKIGLDGVVSSNEQFGAIIAAVLSRRLGLPGTDPLAIIIGQHKYYARMVAREVIPEATPPFGAFPYDIDDPADMPVAFPCFVKPVKATFSVLARRVDSFAELQRHLTFRPFEKFIIRRLVKPFNDLMPTYTDLGIDACNMIAEGLIEGDQFNVDGFVQGGRVHLLGVVDEVMYPGTQAFMRFEYPSRAPQVLLSRIEDLTCRFLRAIGFDHGFFNVELCWNAATGTLQVLEINPRLASQLANLYRRVDGYDPYEMLFALACGETPAIRRGGGEFRTAASFVFRRFDGRALHRTPSRSQIRSALAPFPDAALMLYLKRGASLAREMKWLGSYRYAVLNLGGRSTQDLFDRYERIRRGLAFDPE